MELDNDTRRAQACAQLRGTADRLAHLPLDDPKRAREEITRMLDELGRWSERAGLEAATGEGE
jgi:hypothetical protein